MSGTVGTTREVEVVRAVDGDTLKVRFPEATDDADGEVNLRVLALDTEESRAGGNKPKTPWGVAAKEFVAEWVPPESTVTVEFPGTEPIEECLRRYRGNYGRPLVYVHVDGEDLQERLIREGYSPYFTKYGYAAFESHHRHYTAAEREAQAENRGVWDQLAVNGAEMRDYDDLTSWWAHRAEVVESYRGAEGVFDSRLDYDDLADSVGETVTVFTELSEVERVGAAHAVVKIGSRTQPFKLFVPDAFESEAGERVLSLLRQRYVAESDGVTVARPNRSYAFVTGEVKLYPPETGNPEIAVTSTERIADGPPAP
jgi:micrococcal nuclease